MVCLQWWPPHGLFLCRVNLHPPGNQVHAEEPLRPTNQRHRCSLQDGGGKKKQFYLFPVWLIMANTVEQFKINPSIPQSCIKCFWSALLWLNTETTTHSMALSTISVCLQDLTSMWQASVAMYQVIYLSINKSEKQHVTSSHITWFTVSGCRGVKLHLKKWAPATKNDPRLGSWNLMKLDGSKNSMFQSWSTPCITDHGNSKNQAMSAPFPMMLSGAKYSGVPTRVLDCSDFLGVFSQRCAEGL